jgi:glycosyltransferase involved in cell wall biosynthesis
MDISIIIPTFNDKRHVSKAIYSVIGSTKLKIEIIVVDDGSSDGTFKFLEKKFGDKIKLLKHPSNRGLGASRNTGMTLASGKYILFLDSDDWLDENCLDFIYNLATKEKSEITAFGVRKVWENGQTEPYHAHKFSSKGGIEAVNNFIEYKIGSIVTNKLYLHRFLKKIQIHFTPRYYHEDVMFTLNTVYCCKKYISVENVFYNYLQRDSSIISQKPNSLHIQSFISLIQELQKFISTKKLDLLHPTVAKNLIYAHWVSEFLPKSVKYYRADTEETFDQISQNAFKSEMSQWFIPSSAYVSIVKYISNYVTIINDTYTNQILEEKKLRVKAESDYYSQVKELESIKKLKIWKLRTFLLKIVSKFK